MYLPILRGHFKKISAKDLSNDAYALFLCCFFSFLIFFIKADVVDTRQVDAIQMGTLNICIFKLDKKYTGCNLKTKELLD